MTGKREGMKTAHSGGCFGVFLALTLGANDEEPVKTLFADVVVNGLRRSRRLKVKSSGAWSDQRDLTRKVESASRTRKAEIPTNYK